MPQSEIQARRKAFGNCGPTVDGRETQKLGLQFTMSTKCSKTRRFRVDAAPGLGEASEKNLIAFDLVRAVGWA